VAAIAGATATVNLRSGPGTSHAVVGGSIRGHRINTTSKAKGGWLAVAFGGRKAYIASRYVDRKGALPARPTKINTAGTKIATETLNVRSGPAAHPRGRRLPSRGSSMPYAGAVRPG